MDPSRIKISEVLVVSQQKISETYLQRFNCLF